LRLLFLFLQLFFHQKNKAIDFVKGLRDIILISKDEGLDNIYIAALKELHGEATALMYYFAHAGSEEMHGLIRDINSIVKDEEENKLYLVKISESTTYMENTTEDYDMVLQDNTVLNGVFGGISGIKSELVPIRNGFRFNTEVDLKTIIRSNLDRYFNKPTYYLKDTEAKTISFELDASGYSCN